jgi:hypothetical protein
MYDLQLGGLDKFDARKPQLVAGPPVLDAPNALIVRSLKSILDFQIRFSLLVFFGPSAAAAEGLQFLSCSRSSWAVENVLPHRGHLLLVCGVSAGDAISRPPIQKAGS